MAKAEYPFPPEFEENVVRLVLNDRAFLLGYRKAIDADYFRDVELRWVVTCAIKVFDGSRGHPSVGSVLAETQTKPPEGISAANAVKRARRLFRAGLPEDAQYVRDRVVKFGRHQRLQAVALASGNYLDAGDYDRFVLDVQEANDLAWEKADLSYDYFGEVEKRIAGYEDTLKNCVPTGIKQLDIHLQGGGLGPGEMGIVMGLPGFHKTTTLCNIGVGAMRRGLSVFHGTFEVSAVKTSRRYDCVISGYTLAETLLNRDKATKRMKDFKVGTGADLRVKWWAGRVCTIRELESHLRWLERTRGFRPDVIIADYVAKMAPEGKYDSRMSRMAIGEMYSDFRSLGGLFECPVWSAIQANRDGFRKLAEDDVLAEDNAAESFEPIREADVVVTLNQRKEERQEGVMRLYGAKVRDDAAQWIETVRISMERYTISSYDDDAYEVTDPVTDTVLHKPYKPKIAPPYRPRIAPPLVVA